MLEYFVRKADIKEVKDIVDLLNSLKQRLANNNFKNPYKELNESKELFETIRNIAIELNDEILANAQFVFCKYFLLFSHLTSFFDMLADGEYRKSWDRLQDCYDTAIVIGRYVDLSKRWEVPNVIELLLQYEKLYPYVFFLSVEIMIEKSHCSICGNSLSSTECCHRVGKLYWGRLCSEIFDKVQSIPSISLVEHPKDKRCVIEKIGNESVRFDGLHNYLQLGLPYLMQVAIEEDKVYPVGVLKLKYIVIKYQ